MWLLRGHLQLLSTFYSILNPVVTWWRSRASRALLPICGFAAQVAAEEVVLSCSPRNRCGNGKQHKANRDGYTSRGQLCNPLLEHPPADLALHPPIKPLVYPTLDGPGGPLQPGVNRPYPESGARGPARPRALVGGECRLRGRGGSKHLIGRKLLGWGWGGPRASVPGGVGGRGTGSRDGANFATGALFLLFLTRIKRNVLFLLFVTPRNPSLWTLPDPLPRSSFPAHLSQPFPGTKALRLPPRPQASSSGYPPPPSSFYTLVAKFAPPYPGTKAFWL